MEDDAEDDEQGAGAAAAAGPARPAVRVIHKLEEDQDYMFEDADLEA